MLLRGKEQKYKKESGILLALSSLPSKYGIGSFGKEAYSFIDFLKKTNQTYWQILPLCPLGKGNSPYCSQSSFAGEIMYIDIDMLLEQGLLKDEDIKEVGFPKNVDYKKVFKFKLPLLKKAADNFNIKSKEFLNFKRENEYWLNDYCLFKAIKDYYCGSDFNTWDDGLKYRLPDEIEVFKQKNKKEILFYEITQYLFFEQYLRLKEYAKKNRIKIIGDIPFYVSLESADVWSNPDCFKLGRDLTPVLVAGVPPDIFSSEGQLWGNPIYDWEFQKKLGFSWWKHRLAHNSKLYDVIRIDHFRAFADYYTIPYGAKNAKQGKWEKGVGIEFWKYVKDSFSSSEIIAEDLGGDTKEVKNLIEETGFPNMKILQFAFASDLKNQFLPKNFNKNCICYTGTHDNDTSLGWYQKATPKERLLFSKLVPYETNSPVFNLISFGMKSKARIVIIPLQDYLNLPTEDRMNIPGTEASNWEWRFSKEVITEEVCNTVIKLSKGRN